MLQKSYYISYFQIHKRELLNLNGIQKFNIVFRNSIIFLFVFSGIAKAQTTIKLEEAIQIALRNNNSVQISRLRTDNRKQLLKASTQIPSTLFSASFGQLNSAYLDHQISVSQSMFFPKVFKANKNLNSQEYESSLYEQKLSEIELKKSVSQQYYNILFLKSKLNLFLNLDTMYSEFLVKCKYRFKEGESDNLELSLAQIQITSMHNQILQLNNEINYSISVFQYLLNSEIQYVPVDEIYNLQTLPLLLEDKIDQHPQLLFWKQKITMYQAETMVEKASLYPEILFAVNSITMKGFGADNNYYSRNSRFNSIELGIAIPLLNASIKSKIKASQINEVIAELELKNEKIKLTNELKYLMTMNEMLLEQMDSLESNSLKYSNLISESISNKFFKGEINYLEWFQAVQQSINVQLEYLETKKLFFDNLFSLHYFLNL